MLCIVINSVCTLGYSACCRYIPHNPVLLAQFALSWSDLCRVASLSGALAAGDFDTPDVLSSLHLLYTIMFTSIGMLQLHLRLHAMYLVMRIVLYPAWHVCVCVCVYGCAPHLLSGIVAIRPRTVVLKSQAAAVQLIFFRNTRSSGFTMNMADDDFSITNNKKSALLEGMPVQLTWNSWC